MLETIKTIGSIASVIVTIAACLALFVKPIRNRFTKNADEKKRIAAIEEDILEMKSAIRANNDKYDSIMSILQRLVESDNLQVEASRIALRNMILRIYYRYLPYKAIPAHEFENVNTLYQNYLKLDGNSFVVKIYKEMSDWDVVPDTYSFEEWIKCKRENISM